MVRTRYAPSPTGYMHAGNLRTALYEYLIAKSKGGTFVLRIEDTDQSRLVEGSVEVIYNTLKSAGLQHDEGPDVGGSYGPYIQSERKNEYMDYAKILIEKDAAYYCFCDRSGHETDSDEKTVQKYDRRCMSLSKEEIAEKLATNTPFVVRQFIPEGKTTFVDEVFGEITVNNKEIEDQVLVKSDGLPTYNFANVVDDHLMAITHVVRGSEYLSSTPKYNILYQAFDWDVPTYVHLPLLLNEKGEKMSKRKGDATFDDLLKMGFLPEAVVNYIALLGWSPGDNREIFSLTELIDAFEIKGISKSPSAFDMQKLKWMNGEYIKKMELQEYLDLTIPLIKEVVKKAHIPYERLAEMTKERVNLIHEAPSMLDFIDELPDYELSLYEHKKMKTNQENSKESLIKALETLSNITDWNEASVHDALINLAAEMGIKNGQMLWPVRTALSGKAATPCGATELCEILGRDETLKRIQIGIDRL